MVETRKQAVSIRMNTADVRNVKKLAKRMRVRDSDMIRFAIKCMLSRLGPLNDFEVKGRNLVPVFVESGADLLRYFELDATQLDAIINDSVDPGRRVDRDDIALIALTGASEPYAALMLSDLNRDDGRRTRAGQVSDSVREYLYAKYGYQTETGETQGGEVDRALLPTIQRSVAGGHHD